MLQLVRVWVAFALLWSVAACGDDATTPDGGDAGGPDAGADAETPAPGSFVLAPPAIPWLEEGTPPVAPVQLTPCPRGWREVTGGDVVECDPYPAGGAQTCPDGEAHFVGEAGCRLVGEACPTDDYATTLPTAGPIVYVHPDAPAGGDGSRAAPHGALSDVDWAALTPDATVALAKGTFRGRLILQPGVAVVGACARETRVTGGAAVVDAAVVATTPGEAATVSGVTLRDLATPAVAVTDGAHLSLSGVVIDGAYGIGALAEGAGTRLGLTDVVLRGTREHSPEGTLGTGLLVVGGARLEATRVIVADNRAFGVESSGPGTELVLADVVVRDTLPNASDGNSGLGIGIFEGARVDAARLLVSGNHRTGITAINGGASLTVVDTIVRDTQPIPSDASLGIGIQIYGDVRLDATRLVVAGNHHMGIDANANEAPYTVTLTDTVVRDTQRQASDELYGLGLHLHGRGVLEASRLLLTRNHDSAIFAYDPGVDVILADAVIRDTGPTDALDLRGRGITIYEGAHFEGRRLLIEGNLDTAVAAIGDTWGAEITLIDTVVRSTGPEEGTGDWGRGISVGGGSRLTAARLLVADSSLDGIYIGGVGTEATLDDVVVRDTESRSSDGVYGLGIEVWDGARLDASRMLVRGNRHTGVLVSGTDTVATLTDVQVLDIRPQVAGDFGGRGVMVQLEARLDGARLEIEDVREAGLVAFSEGQLDVRGLRLSRVARALCAGTTCPERTFGYAVAAVAGEARIEDFVVDGAATCGLFLAAFPTLGLPTTSLDLRFGVVANSEIGACVQVEGYDFDRLTDDVDYRGNGSNLDITMLPVPAAVAPLTP